MVKGDHSGGNMDKGNHSSNHSSPNGNSRTEGIRNVTVDGHVPNERPVVTGRSDDRLLTNLQFAAHFDDFPAMIWRADLTSACDYFNKAWLAFTGRTIDQEMGNGWSEGVHPDDLGPCVTQYLDHFHKREPFELEYRLRRHDGDWRWIRDLGRPYYDLDQRFAGYIGSCWDISDHRLTEAELRGRVAFFRAVFNDTGVGVALSPVNGPFSHTNAVFERMLGYSREELTRLTAADITHPEDLERETQLADPLLEGKADAYTLEKRYVRKDGSVVWVQVTVSAVQNSEGRPESLIRVVEDMTSRRQAEEALRESEKRFRIAFGAAPIGMALVATDGRWLQANEALCRLTGYTEEELLRLTFQDVTHPDDLDLDLGHLHELLNGQGTFYEIEKRYITKEGDVVWVLLSASLVRDDDGEPLYFISQIQDISARRRAEEATRQLAAVVSSSSDAILCIDLEGRITGWNAAASVMFGYEPEEVLGIPAIALVPEPTRAHFETTLAAAIAGTRVERYEAARLHKDGRLFHVSSTLSPIIDDTGTVIGVSAIVRDITERKRSEEMLRRYHLLAESTSEIILFFDQDGHVVEANEAAIRAYGYTREELLQLSLPDLRAPEAGKRSWFESALSHAVTYETVNKRKDGSEFPLEITLQTTEAFAQQLFVAVARDITERKSYEEQMARQAFHDRLTELPNRALFLNRLEHALSRSHRRRGRVAVLFLDLDRFKLVNDSKGHLAGDQLLISVASRLRSCLRLDDTIARFGGDEFTILMENVTDDGIAIRLAERVLRKLQAPFEVLGQEVYATASIGIAFSPSAEIPADELLRNADLAMYEAKTAGKARYSIYQPHLGDEAEEQLRFETELRRAIERRQFQVYFQPIVLMETAQTIGVEALVRWQHPRFGLMPPDEFVPLQEQIGLIEPFTMWVLREAMTQCMRWHAAGHKITVSVNLSPRNLHAEKFASKVASLLEVTGLPPTYLKLEITESAVMMDPARALVVMQTMSDAGIRLSIDDFGTGYSSLSYLKQLPVHEIKIDKSFIIGMDERDEDDSAIVRATIDLAHNLRKKVVAEGVETRAVWNLLNILGCDAAQGFYMAQPMPAEDVLLWLQASEWGTVAGQGMKGKKHGRAWRMPSDEDAGFAG